MSSDLMGNYRSAFRGSGLVFSDLREYTPGDDVKKIHWKATARSQRPYVKTFEEDRQLQIILAVDMSRSTLSGAPLSRHRMALDFCALVALLALRGQDRVGLCTFSAGIEQFIPPRQSRAQIQHILYSLVQDRELRQETDIATSLRELMEYQRRQAVIFLISDFFAAPYESELRALSSRHDVVQVCLEDDPERLVPASGLVEFRDAESGERIVLDTSSAETRRALKRMTEERIQALHQLSASCGTDLVRVKDNAVQPLYNLMRRRMARVR